MRGVTSMMSMNLFCVVPAKAGTHSHSSGIWVPAFAGTTPERVVQD